LATEQESEPKLPASWCLGVVKILLNKLFKDLQCLRKQIR